MRIWVLIGSIILGYRPVQKSYAPAHLSREK